MPDPEDNCPSAHNRGQEDYDYDRTGDVCDPDDDEDGVFDTADNCPLVYNWQQADADGDGIGTDCDDSEVVTSAPRAGDGDGGAEVDRTRPAVHIRMSRTQRLREVGRRMAVEVRCDEACALQARLARSGRKGRLAKGTAALGGSGMTYVFMRLKAKLVRRAPMRATLTVTATDAAGNQRQARRKLRLRR